MQPTGPTPAKIMIIGDLPSYEDASLGRPMAGSAGFCLDQLLSDVGINRNQCFVTNVARKAPPQNDPAAFFSLGKKCPAPGWLPATLGWMSPELNEWLTLLGKEVSMCQPDIIVAMGNLALWATTGNWNIGDWRGSQLDFKPRFTVPGNEDFRHNPVVVPVYTPASIQRNWSWRMYGVTDFRRVARLAREGRKPLPHYEFLIRPQFDAAAAKLQFILDLLDKGPKHVACDIETRAGQTACIGFAWSRTEALCIPLMCVERLDGYWTYDEELALVQLCKAVLTHPNALISGQNFSYDSQYIFREWGFIPNLALDTMLTHHVCFPGTEKALDVLSSLYCDQHVYWKDDGKEWHLKMGEDQLWTYNCQDCVRTYEIAEVLCGVVKQLGFQEQAKFQHRMWWLVVDAMIRGVRVDQTAKARFSGELEQEKLEREKWITDLLGHPLNVRSPKQMKGLFYDDFQIKPVLKRVPGKPSVPTLNDEALGIVATREPLVQPLIRRIQEIRSLGVFKSTFVDARLDTDQRFRSSYNVAGTETFRLSSSQNAFGSGLNLQNIPKGGDDDESGLVLPNVRKLFLPDPGYEIADMDLSSADLRVVVWESNCREMKQILAAGLDPYTEIAKEFYNDPAITKKDPRRQKFKSLAHGTNYLGTPTGLSQRIGLSLRDTERTQMWYFRRFPEIHSWQQNLKANLTKTRQVRNAFGYRRHYFDRIEGTIFNQAAAWIPQSTVGLLINKIWEALALHCPDVQVLLQVHDSLVFQYPIERREECLAQVAKYSLVPIPYDDPLVIPTGLKTSQLNWGDC